MMMHQYSINTEELEKHIAERKLEERRKTRERVFLSSIVLGCMVALYIVFTYNGAGSYKEFQKEVNRQPRFEAPTPKNTSINVAPTIQ